MNEIYKWLLLKRLLGKKKKSLSDNFKITGQKNKGDYCSKLLKNYSTRKMEVEIIGEPKIKRTCLSPRSTPIVLEIKFCPKINNEEKTLSKLIKVEWESTHDEIVAKKCFYVNNREENNCENLQIYENELSVAYLGRQNKRVYSERNELIEMKKKAENDDFDSTKVNLSKKSRLEITNPRHLNLGENCNKNENNNNNGSEDLVLVEEWLFEN
ncbi:uncharacterized protein ELE39_002908 [Cryptosporidium sp. chipmunk genotype I]|uniref:uncharacterized protein n=1 Tax=Cryptosporidium sp. chipmunk genotype I TaxID=1280935 RepID=UPI00351A04FF|nr:hypothetical protein ELE39_002908 [Cryptosporidium sp. chipmunk genotype I]